jgi:DUF2955 family protein
MAFALRRRRNALDPAEAARLHYILRFAVGTTLAFTICEVMGWQPSALAAVLSGILLAKIPVAPPFKVGLGLVLVMYLSASVSLVLSMWLYEMPHILFGVIGLVLFLAFFGLANAKAQLPLTLLLICVAIIPLLSLTHPDQAPRMKEVLVRAMGLAVIMSWVMHAIWPRVAAVAPAPPPQAVDAPIATAAIGAMVVLPVMLVYWLFGLADAMPVLLQTVLLIGQMEEERSKVTATAKLLGNFIGGFVAIAAYTLLSISPTLFTFALIVFIMSLWFGVQISKGGTAGSNAEMAFNATMVIFGLFILKDAASGSLTARLVQFLIGCSFAIGMMVLLWPKLKGHHKGKPAPELSGAG